MEVVIRDCPPFLPRPSTNSSQLSNASKQITDGSTFQARYQVRNSTRHDVTNIKQAYLNVVNDLLLMISQRRKYQGITQFILQRITTRIDAITSIIRNTTTMTKIHPDGSTETIPLYFETWNKRYGSAPSVCFPGLRGMPRLLAQSTVSNIPPDEDGRAAGDDDNNGDGGGGGGDGGGGGPGGGRRGSVPGGGRRTSGPGGGRRTSVPGGGRRTSFPGGGRRTSAPGGDRGGNSFGALFGAGGDDEDEDEEDEDEDEDKDEDDPIHSDFDDDHKDGNDHNGRGGGAAGGATGGDGYYFNGTEWVEREGDRNGGGGGGGGGNSEWGWHHAATFCSRCTFISGEPECAKCGGDAIPLTCVPNPRKEYLRIKRRLASDSSIDSPRKRMRSILGSQAEITRLADLLQQNMNLLKRERSEDSMGPEFRTSHSRRPETTIF